MPDQRGCTMLVFDPKGWAVNRRIKVEHFAQLRRGGMPAVHGIIVHQTGAAKSSSTLASYKLAGVEWGALPHRQGWDDYSDRLCPLEGPACRADQVALPRRA